MQNDFTNKFYVYALRLSRPTVAANLIELEEDGLICKNGQLDSDQIGRKAVAYSIVPDYRIAIGVEVMADMVKMIAVDLYGKKIQRVVTEIRYKNEPPYYKKICDLILEFIGTLAISDKKILGIGFAMQGLVSADGSTVVYGKILDCTGLKVDAFTAHLPYPCSLIHDPDGAVLSELWSSPELTSALYLSLSRHLGGSLISKRTILAGKHGHTATFWYSTWILFWAGIWQNISRRPISNIFMASSGAVVLLRTATTISVSAKCPLTISPSARRFRTSSAFWMTSAPLPQAKQRRRK